MIEAPDFLPLGSVVRLAGSPREFMIISRALIVNAEGNGKEYYDYGMVLYPDGLIGETVVYSNHDCIEEVLFEGFRNEAETAKVEALKIALSLLDVRKSDPRSVDKW